MKKFIIIAILILAGTLWLFLSDSKVAKQTQQEQGAAEETTSTREEDSELAEMFVEPVAPTSFGLIDEAYESEEITLDQMYAYKLVAMFRAEKLPEAYYAEVADPLRGDRLIMMIQEDWDTLQPETQSAMEALLLPFSDEESFFFHDNYDLREEVISNLATF